MFYEEHVVKLKKFLWDEYEVSLNKDIKNNYDPVPWKTIQSWVSVIIDFDVEISSDFDRENYLLWMIEKWLIEADDNFKDIFLSWVIDSRGSPDFHRNLIAIDLSQRWRPEMARRKRNKFNDLIGTIFNYNPRLTQENSSSKNDQFRINIKYFAWKFWFFTPRKIWYYYSEFPSASLIKQYSFLTIDQNFANMSIESSASDRNIKINSLAISLKNSIDDDETKRRIIEEYKQENLSLDTDDEIVNSSSNMKANAKLIADYLCEFNHEHDTFTSKSTDSQYVEAHHLIPFCERWKFDVSIDVIENIVCLCPNCHRQIHLAIDEQKKEMLVPLFNSKIESLKTLGITISLERLYSFYKIS